MFAIIETGGKQYSVKNGDKFAVAKLEGNVGDSVEFTRVLAAGGTIGAPVLENARVSATIVSQERADKLIVFKKKRRQNYRRFNGHRQEQTVVQINDIAV